MDAKRASDAFAGRPPAVPGPEMLSYDGSRRSRRTNGAMVHMTSRSTL